LNIYRINQIVQIVKPFQILFEDNHLIVLSKPAGLLSQGEHTGDQNLVDELRTYFGRHYVGLIHRLDRNTSGIMVVAKRTKSAQRLTDSLQTGDIERSYLGWVIGTLEKPARWSHLLEKNEKTNRVHVTRSQQPSKQSKLATLKAQPVQEGRLEGFPLTLVQFFLETGRSHQIRVQSAFEGFPLLGDVKYQKSKNTPPFHRVALHSFDLKFPHPMSQEMMRFQDPLPPDLAALLTHPRSTPDT
jgi:23S rRNA pseudouridine1911/1915/1917 synthase